MEVKERYSYTEQTNKYIRAVRTIRKQIHDPNFKNGQELLDLLQRLHNSTKELEFAVNETKAGQFFEMLLLMSWRILHGSYRKYSTIKINITELRQRFSWTKEDLKKFVCLFRELKRSFNYLNETYVITKRRKEEERKKRGIVRTLSAAVASLERKYLKLPSAERRRMESENRNRRKKRVEEMKRAKERRKEKKAKEMKNEKMAEVRKKEEEAKEKKKKKETTKLSFSQDEVSDSYDSESHDSYDSESYDSESRESYDSRSTS